MLKSQVIAEIVVYTLITWQCIGVAALCFNPQRRISLILLSRLAISLSQMLLYTSPLLLFGFLVLVLLLCTLPILFSFFLPVCFRVLAHARNSGRNTSAKSNSPLRPRLFPVNLHLLLPRLGRCFGATKLCGVETTLLTRSCARGCCSTTCHCPFCSGSSCSSS